MKGVYERVLKEPKDIRNIILKNLGVGEMFSLKTGARVDSRERKNSKMDVVVVLTNNVLGRKIGLKIPN